jgi:pimeloyl-ACP methyl ester carboxylesterase
VAGAAGPEGEESGPPAAPLVALVHGTMDRGSGMAFVARRLDDRFRVLRYDRRGYGRSLGLPGPMTVAQHVADLAALVAGRPVVVFGHSFGGNVALGLASRHPDLVRAVVVYESPMSWEPWWPQGSAGSLAVQAAAEGYDAGDTAETFMRALVGDRIWELTWQNNVAVEWDKATMTPLREVPVNGEGWGLCNDGDRLIRSDGSDRLIFHDPETFAETGSIAVTRDGNPVRSLNELECVDGQVWANIWTSDAIVRIDPATGEVNTVVDASELANAAGRNTEKVLNGIAHIEGDEFLITGKYWPKMFRVRIPSN